MLARQSRAALIVRECLNKWKLENRVRVRSKRGELETSRFLRDKNDSDSLTRTNEDNEKYLQRRSS